MNRDRFEAITSRYSGLKLTIVGDFCLDRYLEIDPGRFEVSIETGLPVFNVVNIRSQPGGAGTILNNLVALGIGEIRAVGVCGDDGEGYELRRALSRARGVTLNGFLTAADRRTFTYTKPLLMHPGKPPEELSRLDIKNWSPTTGELRRKIVEAGRAAMSGSDATIVLDQVDVPETGVICGEWLEALRDPAVRAGQPVIADSRRGLRGWPPVIFKMNAAELAKLSGQSAPATSVDVVQTQASELAGRNQETVFVTLSERGVVGAGPRGDVDHVASHPVEGEIDIVGAGDAVTANLTAALAAGASRREAMELAMAAASIVIHQLGTTGTATVEQLRRKCIA